MAKAPKRAFVCNECGADYPRWQGQCSACQAWNTITEVRLAASPTVARNERLSGYAGNAGVAKVQKLSDISLEELPRFSTGFKEFDRVLGGGVVPGSAILIGGNPGAGKSTLLLQTLCRLAEQMKTLVQRTGAANKESTGRLSAATLDRVSGALTYRVYGCEPQRNAAYEACLQEYERTAVKAGLPVAAMPPLYGVISMTGVLFIFTFGARNVAGTGWAAWDIAAFTTFLSCFGKLAVKSSHAAKLFNAVHKAQVSWKRIKPLLQNSEAEPELPAAAPAKLSVDHLHFAYPNGKEIIHDLSFEAAPGQIIGVTGPVACGKSTLGKTFLCESPYEGSITFGGKELGKMEKTDRNCIIGYLGHDPELFHGSVEDNIRLGGKQGAEEIIRIVCFEEETKAMEDGIHTLVGTSGVRLSGGQAQRLALARTLYHKRPVLVLDDPFSALDKKTEAQIFANVKELARDSIVILISHRLYLFDQMDQVIWMDEGHTKVGTHEELLAEVPSYAELCRDQTKGGSNDEK